MSRASTMTASVHTRLTCDRCGYTETGKLHDVDVSATAENLYLLTHEREKELSVKWARVILAYSPASERKPEGVDMCESCFIGALGAVRPTEEWAAQLAANAVVGAES